MGFFVFEVVGFGIPHHVNPGFEGFDPHVTAVANDRKRVSMIGDHEVEGVVLTGAKGLESRGGLRRGAIPECIHDEQTTRATSRVGSRMGTIRESRKNAVLIQPPPSPPRA